MDLIFKGGSASYGNEWVQELLLEIDRKVLQLQPNNCQHGKEVASIRAFTHHLTHAANHSSNLLRASFREKLLENKLSLSLNTYWILHEAGIFPIELVLESFCAEDNLQFDDYQFNLSKAILCTHPNHEQAHIELHFLKYAIQSMSNFEVLSSKSGDERGYSAAMHLLNRLCHYDWTNTDRMNCTHYILRMASQYKFGGIAYRFIKLQAQRVLSNTKLLITTEYDRKTWLYPFLSIFRNTIGNDEMLAEYRRLLLDGNTKMDILTHLIAKESLESNQLACAFLSVAHVVFVNSLTKFCSASLGKSLGIAQSVAGLNVGSVKRSTEVYQQWLSRHLGSASEQTEKTISKGNQHRVCSICDDAHSPVMIGKRQLEFLVLYLREVMATQEKDVVRVHMRELRRFRQQYPQIIIDFTSMARQTLGKQQIYWENDEEDEDGSFVRELIEGGMANCESYRTTSTSLREVIFFCKEKWKETFKRKILNLEYSISVRPAGYNPKKWVQRQSQLVLTLYKSGAVSTREYDAYLERLELFLQTNCNERMKRRIPLDESLPLLTEGALSHWISLVKRHGKNDEAKRSLRKALEDLKEKQDRKGDRVNYFTVERVLAACIEVYDTHHTALFSLFERSWAARTLFETLVDANGERCVFHFDRKILMSIATAFQFSNQRNQTLPWSFWRIVGVYFFHRSARWSSLIQLMRFMSESMVQRSNIQEVMLICLSFVKNSFAFCGLFKRSIMSEFLYYVYMRSAQSNHQGMENLESYCIQQLQIIFKTAESKNLCYIHVEHFVLFESMFGGCFHRLRFAQLSKFLEMDDARDICEKFILIYLESAERTFRNVYDGHSPSHWQKNQQVENIRHIIQESFAQARLDNTRYVKGQLYRKAVDAVDAWRKKHERHAKRDFLQNRIRLSVAIAALEVLVIQLWEDVDSSGLSVILTFVRKMFSPWMMQDTKVSSLLAQVIFLDGKRQQLEHKRPRDSVFFGVMSTPHLYSSLVFNLTKTEVVQTFLENTIDLKLLQFAFVNFLAVEDQRCGVQVSWQSHGLCENLVVSIVMEILGSVIFASDERMLRSVQTGLTRVSQGVNRRLCLLLFDRLLQQSLADWSLDSDPWNTHPCSLVGVLSGISYVLTHSRDAFLFEEIVTRAQDYTADKMAVTSAVSMSSNYFLLLISLLDPASFKHLCKGLGNKSHLFILMQYLRLQLNDLNSSNISGDKSTITPRWLFKQPQTQRRLEEHVRHLCAYLLDEASQSKILSLVTLYTVAQPNLGLRRWIFDTWSAIHDGLNQKS